MLANASHEYICHTLLYHAIKCYKASHITCYCRSSEAIGNLKGCEASRSQQGYAQAYAANGFFITLLGGARCGGVGGAGVLGRIHCVGVLQSQGECALGNLGSYSNN